jgi:hypothetical protein
MAFQRNKRAHSKWKEKRNSKKETCIVFPLGSVRLACSGPGMARNGSILVQIIEGPLRLGLIPNEPDVALVLCWTQLGSSLTEP